jgi:hypothetical protein
MSDPNQKTTVDQAAYFLALGYFMQSFAEAEMAMQVLLWKVSGLSDISTAAALLSGVKIDGAMGLIRRVREAKKMPEHKQLTHIFNQLAEINSARNDIVHFGATFTEDFGILVSNFRIAHIEERLKGFHTSPIALFNMTQDITKIIHRIIEIVGEYDHDPTPEHVALDTWLYKHKPLTGNQRKPQNKPLKPKRQQKSSPQ